MARRVIGLLQTVKVFKCAAHAQVWTEQQTSALLMGAVMAMLQSPCPTFSADGGYNRPLHSCGHVQHPPGLRAGHDPHQSTCVSASQTWYAMRLGIECGAVKHDVCARTVLLREICAPAWSLSLDKEP